MKCLNPDTMSGSGRRTLFPAFTLGGALLVTFALAGCQKNEADTALSEAAAAIEIPGRPASATPAESAPASVGNPDTVAAFAADPRETYSLAMTAYRERRYEDAQSLFQAYLEQKPEQGFARTMHGLAAWKSGDHATAEMELKIALKADASNDRARFNLARVYLDTNRPRQALELVTARRNSGEAMRLAGRAHHQEGRSEQALEAYRRALILDEEDAWSMNNMALILIEQGNFAEALAPLARAVELRGDVAVIRNNLGVALERTGSHAASAEQYAAAVRLDPVSQHHADASRQRVAALVKPGEESPDMTLLADQFENTIDAWKSSEMAGREDDRR